MISELPATLSLMWTIIYPLLPYIALFSFAFFGWWVYMGLAEAAEEDEARHNAAVGRSRKELEE